MKLLGDNSNFYKMKTKDYNQFKVQFLLKDRHQSTSILKNYKHWTMI